MSTNKMMKIDVEVTVEKYEDDIRRLYRVFRPKAKLEEIRCSEFELGIVNKVVKMDHADSDGAIVVRIYRLKLRKSMTEAERERDLSNTSLMDKSLELEAVRRASELGITVKLCATFRNGFIYRFVDGDVLTFENYDLDIAKKVASKVAMLHRLDLGALANKTPTLDYILGKAGDLKQLQEERDFLDRKMRESEFEEYRSQLPGFKKLCEEMEKIYEILLQKGALGPVCFCHNDLNITNFLIERNADREPILLDFEYCNTNYRMFDISVHLISIGNRLGRYTRPGIPDEQFMKHWLRCYYEANGETRGISENHELFEEFIENELKKVLANMLFNRLLVIRLSIESSFKYPGQNPIENNAKYAVQVYEDYKEKRDKHLRLLDTLKDFEHLFG